ncbi:MAG: NAD(P)/FAD-dependent oxidoreductase [Clostridiales Family XIII bacterium]|jgi:2,4-dienoyl-CoA reductase-like NADH-dependent reductase (Old Yellow Enzyme family)/NADPH-dependent 2,4-dienoyl-CoA reductase/sulfur reductase-like enzyme|nr:NAD(P)/FAD-dependent oxidoreductase [Clostridiales Family XIII bacterium]
MTFTQRYPHLFAPVTLAKTPFRNRIFGAPIGLEYYPNDRLHPGDDFIAFYERKASGGAASVCIGSAMADNDRGAVGPTIRLDDPTALSPLFRLASCINRHGAVADIEMQHCGANAYHSMLTLENDIYGAVDITNGLGMDIPQMPEEVILDTIEKFGDAAQTAKHCGFGMVTIHAGHGWLFNQFLGPYNNRSDDWGGSMENRARITNAIAANIRQKCGAGFPVCIRISGTESTKDGYDIDYGVAIAKELDGHFDLINVSVGAHEAPPAVFTHTHPSMFLEDGVNVKYAAAVKKAVTQSKVAAVGALAEPDLMEEVIASGKADITMVCRELMADPDMPFKAMAGKEDEIRKCIRCFECFSGHFTKESTYCAINPEIGFEREVQYAAPQAQYKQKVLIAGGGVGGMQAALTAANRGHSVILCEKSGELGGALRCERKVPFKQNVQIYLDRQQALIQKHPAIYLRLNTEATPKLAEEVKPDVIIAAIGAKQLIPDIKGIDGPNVMPVEHAFLHAEEVGDRAIILGGGLSGIEMAIYLSGLGKKATIMEMADSLNFSGNIIHSMAITGEIERYGIPVVTSIRAVEISAEGVTGEYVGSTFSPAKNCETIRNGMLQSVVTKHGADIDAGTNIGDRKLYEADTVIYALGMIPHREAADALINCAPVFQAIGDCTTPQNIYKTNAVAYTFARDLGKV